DQLNEQYIQDKDFQETLQLIKIKGLHKNNITDYTLSNLEIIKEDVDEKLKDINNYDKYNELSKLLSNVLVLTNQIYKLKEEIKLCEKKQLDRQINYNTCSSFLQEYIKKHNITGCNDKEACSLVLLMALLKPNGICAAILKEGIFFD